VPNVHLDLAHINTPAKAASLAAWLQRHAPCLGGLTLDVTTPPYSQHLILQLQQVLPALQQAALASADIAAAAAAAGGGGGGGGPLGLTRLVLKGSTGGYQQLGTLLRALR
jgi:hypothetical protein